MESMRFWHEIFSKFLLDIAKVILTAFVVGKFVMPDLISYVVFWCGIVIMVLVIGFSRLIAKKVN